METDRPLGTELLDALERIASTFVERSIRYALIGGFATLLRGRPRFTQDIDFLLDVPQVKLPGLLDALVERGFTLDPVTIIREYVQLGITKFYFGNIRVDWLKPSLPLYARALKDADDVEWENGQILRVATPEGLILTKLLAFRPQDQTDIETLISANPTLDPDVIRSEWAFFASREPARTTWLNSALAKLPANP